MQRTTLLTLCCLIATSLVGERLLASERSIERTFDVREDVSIEIEILAGSIEITGWDKNQVHVTAKLDDDVTQLDISADEDEIDISIDLPEERGRHWRDLDVQLEVHVPRGADIEIETLSAGITVIDADGQIELASMSGDLSVDGDPASVEAETVSGNIHFAGSCSDVEIETVSGDVDIAGVDTSVEVTTVNGSIDVEGGVLESCSLESVSGDVQLAGSLARDGDVDIAVHSSDVVLALPDATSAQFDVSTFSGSIANKLAAAERRTDSWGPAETLNFKIGDGTGTVSIQSFSGSVTLKKR